MFRSLLRTRARVAAVATAAVLALAGCGDQPGTEQPAQETPPQGQRQPAGEERSGSSTGQTSSSPQSPSGPQASPPAFVVTAGEVEGPAQITTTVGEEVVFTVTADTADEVHVHGYDITVPVEPGKPATVRFPADIPGIFEVELESEHQPLTQLRVSQ
jgi:hypothetical protein